jgi:tryptophanyl-tRNA synthetase
MRARFVELKSDEAAIDAILDAGAARARELAAPTLCAAHAALGLHA